MLEFGRGGAVPHIPLQVLWISGQGQVSLNLTLTGVVEKNSFSFDCGQTGTYAYLNVGLLSLTRTAEFGLELYSGGPLDP